MSDLLQTDITYLPGVGPKRAEYLKKELDLNTYEDLLYYFPYKYIDRTKFYKIHEIHSNLPYIQIKGYITGFEQTGEGRKKRLVAYFSDKTGEIQLVWFNRIKWIQQQLQGNTEYVVFGKPSLFNNTINLIHPEIEKVTQFEEQIKGGFQAIYSTTEKLKKHFITSKVIAKLQNNLWQKISGKINEILPAYLIRKLHLLSLPEALYNIHFPGDTNILQKANYRLKFDELFFIQLHILRQKYNRQHKFEGFVFPKVDHYFNRFYHHNLSFSLTKAQMRVLKEIRSDLNSGNQMNRLLQGDVGSGKTLVALMTILIALDNGYQTCFMAPTEILANQHFETIKHFLYGLDISMEILTSSTKQSERNRIHNSLLSGNTQILVGTHALIEDVVRFRNLGMVIIDEQHRFGVAQRAKLWKKNAHPPHILVMTATPIPRTLAMTLYGDLDVSIIDELPPGRKPIKTFHYYDSKRLKMFGFLRKQIDAGRQVFIVYPLIKESEKLDYKNLEDGIESIKRAFPPPKYAISVVHGKMKPEEKDTAMQLFIQRKSQIMVATTVIEVGVDIPNATTMVIESAERFGLSQLHQLRGRVGRGADQSYCILMSSEKLSNDAKRRINAMVQTNDGFEIANADLKLRGPGDMEGTQQSGMPFHFKIANLGKDGAILQYARNIAASIIENDPNLKLSEHKVLQYRLKRLLPSDQLTWSSIS